MVSQFSGLASIHTTRIVAFQLKLRLKLQTFEAIRDKIIIFG